MSQYPTCHHGHDDPNTDCDACEIENRNDAMQSELSAAKDALEEAYQEIERLHAVIARAMLCGVNGALSYSAREANKTGEEMKKILENAKESKQS